MDQELFTTFELLQGRLALMQKLATSLELGQAAIVRSNLAAITSHTARQEELCEAIRQLENEALRLSACTSNAGVVRNPKFLKRLPESGASGFAQRRWSAVAQQLTEVEMQVGQLNLVYGALLRRAQRTVDIFCRVLACSAITYAPPKYEAAMAQAEFGEVSHV
jgi:hypothetical protein